MKSFYEARVIDIAVLYEIYTTLSILSLATRRDTRTFPASTALPALTFPSLHRIKVPNVAYNDAEDINVKHSNFKQYLAIRLKLRKSFLHYCGYSLSSNHMSFQRAFVIFFWERLGDDDRSRTYFCFNIPTHIDAASLPGGISRSLPHVIDLQLHSDSQYSNGYIL